MPAVTTEVRSGFCIGISVPGGTVASQDRFRQEQKIRASPLTDKDKSEATMLVTRRDELAKKGGPFEEVARLQDEVRKQPWSSIVENWIRLVAAEGKIITARDNFSMVFWAKAAAA